MKWIALLLCLPLALAACGSEDDPSDAGTLAIEAHVEPDPPRVGTNTLHLTIHDADGAPVTGAAVSVEALMPAHGHGSTEKPVITEQGGGAYTAAPLTLQMPGRWEVTIRATAGGESGERVLRWDVQ